jgi:hypothetical protein
LCHCPFALNSLARALLPERYACLAWFTHKKQGTQLVSFHPHLLIQHSQNYFTGELEGSAKWSFGLYSGSSWPHQFCLWHKSVSAGNRHDRTRLLHRSSQDSRNLYMWFTRVWNLMADNSFQVLNYQKIYTVDF